MDKHLMMSLYSSIGTTGFLTEEGLLKEINSEGVNPAIRRDLIYRLLVLRHNGFDTA